MHYIYTYRNERSSAAIQAPGTGSTPPWRTADGQQGLKKPSYIYIYIYIYIFFFSEKRSANTKLMVGTAVDLSLG
jgi:hypothetical protein